MDLDTAVLMELSDRDDAFALRMIMAWGAGDHDRFRAITLQFAAKMARSGDPVGRKVRDHVDRVMSRRTYLPAFSGINTGCRKCAAASGATVKYVKEGEADFMERECSWCGYVWYERCNDAEAGNV